MAVFLVDIDGFEAMNGVGADYFEVSHPARSAAEVGRVPEWVALEAVATIE